MSHNLLVPTTIICKKKNHSFARPNKRTVPSIDSLPSYRPSNPRLYSPPLNNSFFIVSSAVTPLVHHGPLSFPLRSASSIFLLGPLPDLAYPAYNAAVGLATVFFLFAMRFIVTVVATPLHLRARIIGSQIRNSCYYSPRRAEYKYSRMCTRSTRQLFNNYRNQIKPQKITVGSDWRDITRVTRFDIFHLQHWSSCGIRNRSNWRVIAVRTRTINIPRRRIRR